MKKILFLLESRASFGYSKNIIRLIKKKKNFTYKTLVTGTHLSRELGNSYKDLGMEKINLNYKFYFNKNEFSDGISKTISFTGKILDKYKPDFVFIFGDRVELIGTAIACVYKDKVVCHVQAGDKSGHIDDLTRMTLAKLCHIHFPATEAAKRRLIRLGEEKFRIFKVGAPQLDDIDLKKIKKTRIFKYKKKNYRLDKNNYFVLLQHSVFKDRNKYDKIFEKTLKACLKFHFDIFIVYPNYDPGYKFIIKLIKKYQKKYKNKIFVFRHLKRLDFLRLAFYSSTFIGNSSAGILESPSLNVGTVNIGDRQNKREQNKNIFNSDYKVENIVQKIKKSIFYNNNKKNIKNIHGDGKSSKRILNVINSIKNTKDYLNKNTTY